MSGLDLSLEVNLRMDIGYLNHGEEQTKGLGIARGGDLYFEV
jgi:hypothetical protein